MSAVPPLAINLSTSSTVDAKHAWAADFSKCTVVGDHRHVSLHLPSAAAGPAARRIFSRALFAEGSAGQSLLQQPMLRVLGAFPLLNHAWVAFSTLLEGDAQHWALLAVDCLTAVTGAAGASEPASPAFGDDRTPAVRCVAAPRLVDSRGTPLRLLNAAPIGGDSVLLIAVATADHIHHTSTDSATGGALHVGVIKNVAALLAAPATPMFTLSAEALDRIEWVASPIPRSLEIELARGSGTIRHHRGAKHQVIVTAEAQDGAVPSSESVSVVQNPLTESIAMSPSSESAPLPRQLCVTWDGTPTPTFLPVHRDPYREMPDDCPFCLLPLFPSDDDPDCPPALTLLWCGHGYHRECLGCDLERVDDFIAVGRYFRFRRLACSLCHAPMRDGVRFPGLEHMWHYHDEVRRQACSLDAALGGSAHDDTPLEDRLKRHLFYLCHRCKEPFYGGPYDCGATLSDPQTKPENLVCDACIDDFVCSAHGRTHVVYKCAACWNPAKPRRFLGRLRLCAACFSAQKGKPLPADDVTAMAQHNAARAPTAAPVGTPFHSIGTNWAVCGHDAQGQGLSIAGCAACDTRIDEARRAGATAGTDAAPSSS